ncbi:sulfotransferase 1A3-like [Macrobrachium nipponense]|uniref:sulfotransferase 1A3-like n=1 Tax=Macrobrachium nipponense TaxID=159736 RepID=UPI0030C84D6D
MKLKSGHESVHLQGPEMQKQVKDFPGYENGLVRLHPGRWLYPTNFEKFANGLYNFKFKSSDVVVMTWPKCGTTWTQEIVWTMRSNPDLNHPDAHMDVRHRSPFIDSDMLKPIPSKNDTTSKNPFLANFRNKCPDKDPADGIVLQLAAVFPDPRTIKTHLPLSLMPPSLLDTAKVVYVARNPKDVIVSYHHHSRVIKSHDFVGSLDDFVQYFVDDDLLYGPYWLHLKEAWDKREHPNLHFLFYEDLKENTLEELRKLDTFLETNLTEAQLEAIIKYTSFGEMKARDEICQKQSEWSKVSRNLEVVEKEGGLFRKGEAGDWKNKLTTEQGRKVDRWTEANLSGLGINFKYGLKIN